MVDWPDYETWPDEQIALYSDAAEGLDKGDMLPLAAYIRAGYPVGGGLARMLADAIEGSEEARFIMRPMKGRSRGQRKSDAFEDHHRMLQHGALAHARLLTAKRSEADAIILEVAKELGVGTTRVREGLAYFRKQIRTISSPDDSPLPAKVWDPINAGLALGEALRRNPSKN